jgi:hypothetical protein
MLPMTDPIFLLVGDAPEPRFKGFQGTTLRRPEEVRAAFVAHRKAQWVAARWGLRLVVDLGGEGRGTWHRLLCLERLDAARRELLSAAFRLVVAPGEHTTVLSLSDLREVLSTEHPQDYFVGGVVDRDDGALVLYRGNLERLVVPLSWFRPTGRGSTPNFDDFEIIDCGQTVRFGDYEAATDAILYEFDRAARQRMKKREIQKDRSFGGALRRLRLQKGLSRADFGHLTERTIARIERGEVKEPHGPTLRTIAKRLGVKPDEIPTY